MGVGGGLGRGRLIKGCRNKVERCTDKSVNWRRRSTKLFAIIYLNLEIYYIVREKLSNIFIVSSQTTSYIAQMQYMYDSLQMLFHTAIPVVNGL